MNLSALKIDPEFQGKIPPLTFEELNQLEANILRDGRIINPIIVWEGLIVDGHNRFIIAKKQPSSGSARISWGGAISPRNRRSTLSGNSMKPKNALMAVIEKALRQNQVVILTT